MAKVKKSKVKVEKAAEAPAALASTSKIIKKPKASGTEEKKDADKPSCAVKLGRIPYGFFENELLNYFKQFGRVQRVRVARNKKTGNHKGWAFIEFTSPEVAQVVAETMNGYLMFEKRMYCKVLKKSEVPKCLLKGKTLLRRPAKYATARLHTKVASAPKTEAQEKAAETRLRSRLKKKEQQLAALGLNYNFELDEAKPAAAVKQEVKNEKAQVSEEKTKAEVDEQQQLVEAPSKKKKKLSKK